MAMSVREITHHKTNACNEAIEVTARDGPGPGGASHVYHLAFPTGPNTAACTILNFQNGPIKEVGTNGITHEALLAVLIDRLEGFQSGPYACTDNKIALELLRNALEVLNDRTAARVARGVEGTMQI